MQVSPAQPAAGPCALGSTQKLHDRSHRIINTRAARLAQLVCALAFNDFCVSAFILSTMAGHRSEKLIIMAHLLIVLWGTLWNRMSSESALCTR